MWADSIGPLRHNWFGLALEAWIGTGSMGWIAADAIALWAERAFRAIGSGMVKAPAEGTLGDWSSRPHRPDWTDAVEN